MFMKAMLVIKQSHKSTKIIVYSDPEFYVTIKMLSTFIANKIEYILYYV